MSSNLSFKPVLTHDLRAESAIWENYGASGSLPIIDDDQFRNIMQSAVDRASHHNESSSLLLIELDVVQKASAQFGRETGNHVLSVVCSRLELMLRKNESLSRLGQNELAMVVSGHPDPQSHCDMANNVASRVMRRIGEPITIRSRQIEISANIGVALCRQDSESLDSVLQSAAQAMACAKASDKPIAASALGSTTVMTTKRVKGGSIGFFEQAIDKEVREQEALEADLRQAIAEHGIKPYFQPIVDIQVGRIRSFEALARWHHPTRGFIPPDKFIPMIESLGLMSAFSDSILTQVCIAARDWTPGVIVSVNFSLSELDDPKRADRIMQIVKTNRFDPKRLEVEITETAIAQNMVTVKKSMDYLRNSGISLSLDDFGTGYATLTQLRHLQFDKIKIDKSFVQGMNENEYCNKIVDSVLSLAGSLNMQTVAEGVETMPLMLKLRDRGCEYGQGYLFSKAVSAGDVQNMLKKSLQ